MKAVCQIVMVGSLLIASGFAWAAEEKAEKPSTDLEQIIASAATCESGQNLEPFRRLEQAVRDSLSKPIARREIEAGLVRLLGTNSTFEARKFACKQLGFMGSQAALPALATLASDPETAGIACLALTTYPPGKGDEILRAGLRSANTTIRLQMINTLGDRRDEKSVSLLYRSAESTDKEVAEAATAALGKIGTPAAWKFLQSLRKTEGGPTGAMADAMLRCAGNFQGVGNAKAARAIYEDLLANAGNKAVRRSALSYLFASDRDGGRKRVLEVLSGDDEALKPVAIRAIATIPDAGASEEFAGLMNHLAPEQQALMVETLAARGDDAARLQLAKALSVPEVQVRRAAITALGRMADPYFISLLVRAAGSAAEPDEARAIEAALAGMKGGADTDKQLTAQLKLAVPKARTVLIAVLVRRKGAAATDIFLGETENPDPVVAKAAFRALAKVGTGKTAGPVIAKLTSLHDAGVRTEAEGTAAQLLAKIPDGPKRSAIVCESLNAATTVETRNALISLLPACGDAAALKALKNALSDPETEVQEAAVRALAEWPDDAAWNDLAEIYRRPQQDNLRGIALQGLVRLLRDKNPHPDATLINHYKDLLASSRSEADLKLLLGTIAEVSDPDALNLVLPLLANNAVHAEAALAVKKIAESIKAQHPQVAEEALKKLPPNP